MSKMMWKRAGALLLSSAMVFSSLAALAADGTEASGKPRAQDDFYDYVNYDWAQGVTIPDDELSVGGFNSLATETDETLMKELDALASSSAGKENGPRAEMVKYYKLATDYDRMNREGAQPVRGQILTIQQLSSLKEFNQRAARFTLDTYSLPFVAGVSADMKDATKNAIYLQSAGVILPSKAYYAEGNETGKQLLELFKASLTQLLGMTGFNEEEAEQIATDTLAFDAILAKYEKDPEEMASDRTQIYNPVSIRTLKSYSDDVDVAKYLTDLLGEEPDEVVLTNVEFFKNIDDIINEENFDIMKSWMIGLTVYGAAPYLSDDLRETYYAYTMGMTGMQEIPERKKDAYQLTSSAFGDILGEFYVEKHFSAEAKADVEKMVENMIAVYKSRLQSNDWLGDKTKAEAVKKLDKMTVMVGYPDEIADIYKKAKVDSTKSFYENARNISRIYLADNFAGYGDEADRDTWIVPAHTVNAFYSATTNSIVFPAGILQAPFYDIEQSASANYGGIGMVIAHEISHAFDNTGSKYDEKGNLSNWWTKDDYAEFEKRSQAMVELFNGREYAGGKVSGIMTLGENIADAGGMRCALEVTKSLPDADLDAFFTNNATIWAMVARSEYEQLVLSIDTHAPNKLRTNVQAGNVQEFYDTYDVTDKDGMYIAPEDRVEIW